MNNGNSDFTPTPRAPASSESGAGHAPELTIDRRLDGAGRAYVATLFSMMRPWQAFALISEHWEVELDRLYAKDAKPMQLKSEVVEARTVADEAWLLSRKLKAADDEEAREVEEREEAGEFDEIHAFLAEEVKRRPVVVGRIKHPHRFAEDDSRCVYCGKVKAHAPPMEECKVLLAARSALIATTGDTHE